MVTAKHNNKGILLTEGPPWKGLLRFAIPIFIGSLLQQLYHTMDTMMVGKMIGEQALSGVGTVGVLTNLLIAFSVGFSAGSSVISAQLFGGRKEKEITRNAYASLVFLSILGIVIAGISIVGGKWLLKNLVAVPDTLIDHATEYFTVCAVGFLFQFLYNGIAALLRSVGDSQASLYFLTVSSLINIALNYAFIAWFKMGVAGAAWATVISQLLACVVSFWYMVRKYEMFRFWNKGIKLGTDDFSVIINTGFPMALQSMVGTIFNLFVQRLVNSFGDAMIASYTVVGRVEGYMHLPTNTLNQAISTYTAQNIGAKKPERVSKGLRHTIIMTTGITLICSIISFAFAETIAAFFGISGQAAAYCVQHIRTLAFPFLLFAFYFPCTGLYQGAGRGMASTMMSAIFLILCLSFGYGLQYIPAIGHTSLFICKPLAWMIVVPFNYWYYFRGTWRKVKIITQ